MKNLKKFEFEFPLLTKIGSSQVNYGSLLVTGECYQREGEAMTDWEEYTLVGDTSTTDLVNYHIHQGSESLQECLQQHIEAVLSGEIVSKQQPERLENYPSMMDVFATMGDIFKPNQARA